jgi:DNA-binding Lrp family transcriptional regulator
LSNSTASAPDVVRDGRRGRFWMDDDILDHYAKELGVHGLAVYTVLCRRAGKNGQSHPSVRRIAEDLGISERQAKRELKKLKDLKLITIQRRDTQNKTSVYTILETPPGDSQSPTPVTVSHPKEDTVRKEGVEANASSGKPQSVGLEKYIVDQIYRAMREAKLRLPNEHFTYQLGRAQDVIAKDDPTDAEIRALPAAFVRAWKIWGRADAHTALMEMRRQKARAEVLAEDNERPSETPHPHSAQAQEARDKPRAVSWYLSFYSEVPEQLEAWIAGGATHSEIVARLERGAA